MAIRPMEMLRAAPVVDIRGAGLSFRLNLRVAALIGIALVVLLALAAWAMTLGSYPISVTGVIASVFGRGADDQEFIVRTLRLPRVLVAVLVGIALGMSGGVFQGLVRNPLVSPDIIGITAGATLVAVYWLVNDYPFALLPVVAFIGASLTAAVIYLLSWRGGVSPDRLILMGIGIQAVLVAGTTFVMTRYPIERVSSAQLWMTGSVYASSWEDVRILAIALLVLAPLAVTLMWPLRVLQFGDAMAGGLGLQVELTRAALMLVGCALAATAVAICGPIAFVALMTPHMARMLAGPMTGAVLLLAGLLGAIVLLAADMVGQHALPVAMPVGVVTSAVGAPYFLFLLWRSNGRML
jgi:iron complex transport system permease protein